MEIDTHIPLEFILENPENLATMLPQQDRDTLGRAIAENFNRDRESRSQWEERMEIASKIALQVVEKKTFPWPGASNVKFPLVTIACLQYHSRAYPALIDFPDIVKCAPVGQDPTGQKLDSARRIEEHMSWQLSEEDESWEEEMDRSLLVQPLMGTAFKKTYWDSMLHHNVSECVLPQDFVVNYWTKSLDKCPRSTHILSWSHNDMEERLRRGAIIVDNDQLTKPREVPIPFGRLGELKDKAQGLAVPTQDEDTPYVVLEHHFWYDLDGDGLREPYVAFVRWDNRKLLRLSPRYMEPSLEYKGGVLLKITPERYFTKYPFIPSPDGGFYDLGFGALLGPLNESIDTSINQLFDAGTMHNAGGGFLGRGARIKKGDLSFGPNQWKQLDVAGGSIRDNIFPLPVREPSQVLFNLMQVLIEYGQRVAGAPEITQGQTPGQNTPAETSRNALEQGIKVFSGIYKRTYRSFKHELKKQYRLNELHVEETQEFISLKSGLETKILAKDYQLPSSAVRPIADPYYMSDSQRMNQAMALVQRASPALGYDMLEVEKIYLRAWKVPGIEKLIPIDPQTGKPAIQPPPNPKIQIEQMKLEAKKMEFEQTMRIKLFELMEEHELNAAKIIELHAKAMNEVAQADGVSSGHAIAELNTAIAAAKLQHEARKGSIELLRDLLKELNANDKGGLDSMAKPGANAGVNSAPQGPAH